MMGSLPETVVEAIEHLIKRYVTRNIALPLMGEITAVNGKTNTCTFKPYHDKPVFKNVPLTLMPVRDVEQEPPEGFALRPRVGSKAIVSFVNGSWELPIITWFEDVDAVLVYGDTGVLIQSPGFIDIVGGAGVSIQGRPVLSNSEPL